MDKNGNNNEQLKSVFDSLVDLALRIADEKNTTGKDLEILPAVVDKIVLLKNWVR